MIAKYLILASGSPRRQELLSLIVSHFKIECVPVDETPYPHEAPEAYAQRVALDKARAVADPHAGEETLILAADTIVVLEQKIFGKPRDEADAIETLLQLSGKTHQVITSVVGLMDQEIVVKNVISEVQFRNLDRTEAINYWRTGEPSDKAGAYALQGRGGVFVEKINGSPSSIIGLPLCETLSILQYFEFPSCLTTRH